VEHVGSTAVPGLPAKPVVDILVALAEVEDQDRELYATTKQELARRDWPTMNHYAAAKIDASTRSSPGPRRAEQPAPPRT
jgi:GrpB-like predicted nucleotidyltransferase (UPF0157 family)